MYSQIEDTRMNHIMKLAHKLLQYFAYENPTNQAKLYELYFNDYQQLSEVELFGIEPTGPRLELKELEFQTRVD
jgi:hypothetical protein